MNLLTQNKLTKMTQTFNKSQLELIHRVLTQVTDDFDPDPFTDQDYEDIADLAKEIKFKYLDKEDQKEEVLSRYEYNVKIVLMLSNSQEFRNLIKMYKTDDVDEFINDLGDAVYWHKDQRFAQIWCNYIVPDYREPNRKEFARESLDFLFGTPYSDPFYIESKTTYNKLRNIL